MTRLKKLDDLVSSVEDLLAQLPDAVTPEVAALRDRVDAGIFEAWTHAAREVTEARNRASQHSGARFWNTVGLALLAGASSLLAYRISRPAARLP